MTEPSNDSFIIRDMRKTDLDDLLDLLPRCFAKEFQVTGFDPEFTKDMFNHAFEGVGGLFFRLASLFGREPVRLLASEAGGHVVGTTIVQVSERTGYISTVMVHPDYRRRGIATELVKRATEYIRSRGRDRAILHVDSTNAPAIGVYSRLGFEPFERVVHLLGGTDAVLPRQPDAGVEARLYQEGDRDAVYDLIRASGDPDHLRVYGFAKKDLVTPFWMRLVSVGTRRNMVAVRSGRIVGYVEAGYTSPKEAGYVDSSAIPPGEGDSDVARVLLSAAMSEIRNGGVGKARAAVTARRPDIIETLRSLGFADLVMLVGMFKELAHGGESRDIREGESRA